MSRPIRTISRDPLRRLQAVAWGLAVLPLLFAPPIAAIVIAWRASGQRRPGKRFDPTWITIVAGLNLVVSASVIHRYAPDVSSLMAQTQRMLVAPHMKQGEPRLQSI